MMLGRDSSQPSDEWLYFCMSNYEHLNSRCAIASHANHDRAWMGIEMEEKRNSQSMYHKKELRQVTPASTTK